MERDEIAVRLYEKYLDINLMWNAGTVKEKKLTMVEKIKEAVKDADTMLALLSAESGQPPRVPGFVCVSEEKRRIETGKAARMDKFFDVVADKHPRLVWQWMEEADEKAAKANSEAGR